MSVYSVKGKGWRYDFTLKGTRHTEAWFKTKREARQAEAKRKEEVQNPELQMITDPIPTDMGFLDLVNRRLTQDIEQKLDGGLWGHADISQTWILTFGQKHWGYVPLGGHTGKLRHMTKLEI